MEVLADADDDRGTWIESHAGTLRIVADVDHNGADRWSLGASAG